MSPAVVHQVFPMVELGGSQIGTLNLAVALREIGVECRFLAGCATAEGSALYRREGFEIDCYRDAWEWGMDGPWRPDYASWLRGKLADAEIVHAHHGAAWWQVAQVLDERIPLLTTEHSVPPYSPVILAQLAAASPRLDHYYSVGSEVRALARGHGVPSWKMSDGFSPIVGLGAEPAPGLVSPRLVFAGRLVESKHGDVLLEALALMDHPPHTYILGTGPMEDTWRRQCAELGLADTVEFCGWQDHPEQFISGAAIVAVPSSREAWGSTAVQAMAYEVPVVGCASAGLSETLGYGARGLLAALHDPEGLARALAGVLAGELSVDLQAAKSYAQQFAPTILAARYRADYRSVLAARCASAGRRTHSGCGTEKAPLQ